MDALRTLRHCWWSGPLPAAVLERIPRRHQDHASVGGEEFKAYAFDYWQYLNSMVFWEGLVPTPDVIDAGHRNGVPVLGTLFFNWSNSIADQEKFAAALQQDEDGTFPIARKLVDLAKYYGFDGYFINQETTGELVEPLGKKMRDFMLYTKEYAAQVNHPVKYSWYDAMTYEYGRYHADGLGEYNYHFHQKGHPISLLSCKNHPVAIPNLQRHRTGSALAILP